MLNDTIKLHYFFLGLVGCTSLSSLQAAQTYSVESEAKEYKNEDGNPFSEITFSFKYDGKPLTVAEVIKLSGDGYTKKVQNMFVKFTKEITEATRQNHLWEGFYLTADLSNKQKDFTYKMIGDSYPESGPNGSSSMYDQYMVPSVSKSTNKVISNRKNFNQYEEAGKDKLKQNKALAFTDFQGKGILVTPSIFYRRTSPYITIFDFGREAEEGDIIAFWGLMLAVWHNYRDMIEKSRFDAGETSAGAKQTVPRMSALNTINQELPYKKKLIACGDENRVFFEDFARIKKGKKEDKDNLIEKKDNPMQNQDNLVENNGTEQNASYDGKTLFWQEPMVVFLGVIFMMGSVFWYISSSSHAEKEVQKSRKAKLKKDNLENNV